MRIVYALVHNKTGRAYIGSAEDGNHRIKQHLNQLRAGKHPVELMQKDFDEYGEDFSAYQLDVIPTNAERYREYYWMGFFETWNPDKGYNVKDWAAEKTTLEKFPKIDMEKPAKRERLSKYATFDDSTLYGKVRKLCAEKDISVTALEKKAGLSNGLISKWKNGITPTTLNVQSVAKVLNKPIEYFLDDCSA